VKQKPRTSGRTDQANFRLPKDLIRKVRLEAADLQVYPNEIVEKRLRESYEQRPLSIVA